MCERCDWTMPATADLSGHGQGPAGGTSRRGFLKSSAALATGSAAAQVLSRDGIVVADTQTGEVFEPDCSANCGPARGEFDPQGNYWSGGRGGMLVKFDIAKKRLFEYPLPTPYASMYSAQADKNGEIWAGEMHAGRYLRFNPKTEQFTEYVLPEPYGIDRETWIDNSTDPVTVWYVDHVGWIVRIQPLD